MSDVEVNKSLEQEFADGISKFSPPSFHEDSFFKPMYNVDCWISLDISMLKTILNHLLDSERIMKEYRNDMNFRVDVLK